MATSLRLSFLPVAAAAILLLPTISTYNVVNLGADPSGRMGSTKAFLAAWQLACRSKVPAVIDIPPGKYLIGSTTFQGPCLSSVSFNVDGTIRALDYISMWNDKKWILFIKVRGLSIYGGTIDGQGASLWTCKLAKRKCPLGVHSLTISNSQKVLIKNLTSFNPKFFHLQIQSSSQVTVDHINIISPANSPNTDGIHIQQSDRVTINDANIKTGDDCISIGPGTTNLYIDRISCGPGHGISIGSLGSMKEEPGVENVTVKTVTMTETQNGVRIKTWANPSNGTITNVLFQNIIMKNVGYPIFIDQHYCPLHNCPSNQESGVKIKGVTYNFIRGTSSTQTAVKLDCSASNPCKSLRLAGIGLTYGDQPAVAYCKNAWGTSAGYVTPPSCLK